MLGTRIPLSLAWRTGCALASATALSCVGGGAGIRWDSRDHIWLAEESQVEIRNAQSRTFDATDRTAMMAAVISTLQDLHFQIDVLDEKLGIVSGKKFVPLSRPKGEGLKSYLLYDEESLVIFNRVYRDWGPFQRRSDLVRLTVTVRERNEQQLIVRAAAQFYLQPVEDPLSYQNFFAALRRTYFAGQHLAAEATPSALPTSAH